MHCTTQEACGSVTPYCFCLYICEAVAAVTVWAECFQWVLCRNICLALCVCVCAESWAPLLFFSQCVHPASSPVYVRASCAWSSSCVLCERSRRTVAPECVSTYRGGSVWRLMINGGGGGLISAPVECDYKQPGRRNKWIEHRKRNRARGRERGWEKCVQNKTEGSEMKQKRQCGNVCACERRTGSEKSIINKGWNGSTGEDGEEWKCNRCTIMCALLFCFFLFQKSLNLCLTSKVQIKSSIIKRNKCDSRVTATEQREIIQIKGWKSCHHKHKESLQQEPVCEMYTTVLLQYFADCLNARWRRRETCKQKHKTQNKAALAASVSSVVRHLSESGALLSVIILFHHL